MHDAALTKYVKLHHQRSCGRLWVSVYWGIYFFCMSVLHLYNNKERKGKQSSNQIQSKHSAETDDTLLVWKQTDLTGVVVGVN